MAFDQRRIERALSSGARQSGQSLPESVLTRAGSRLGTVALLVAGTFTFFLLFNWVFFESKSERLTTMPPPYLLVELTPEQALTFWEVSVGFIATTVFGVLVSIAVWFVSRSGRVGADRLVGVGLAYEILIALVLSAMVAMDPLTYLLPLGGISWTVFWIGIFPLIVPAQPWKSLAAALLAAATAPLCVFVIGPLLMDSLPDTKSLWGLSVPPFVAAAWSYVGARVVYQYGREIRRAKQMGSYELVQKLGEGGMGEVWHAEHRFLARPAAVKLIRPESLGVSGEASRTALRRFEREAQAVAALRSPHTVELFDFGVTGEGTFFFVMELLDGLDLESLVVRFGPQPQERVVHLLVQVCDSLSEAHEAGMIHRDIKPANIFTCHYGRRYDVVKVLDFGLVRAEDPASSQVTRLTKDGVVTGTPAYIAPELALGEPDVDHRADLYSLGCVAYWLLTGELVFEADSAVKMVVAHAQEACVAPSKRTEMTISPELEALILACLSKDPHQRPNDADELAARLLAIDLAKWTPDRAAQWWRAHRPMAGGSRVTPAALADTLPG